jgi:DNA-binding Lrp family transcriptional regulator
MMPSAFVLINTEVGLIDQVLEFLKKTPGVKEAYGVYGVYDIVSKVNTESMSALKETVIRQIRSISGVRSTLTMIIMEEIEK